MKMFVQYACSLNFSILEDMLTDNLEPENVVQAACIDALTAFFDRENITYRHLSPYANQQGEDPNRFCADVIGVIDNSALLLLEMKAYDRVKKELHAFDDEQFSAAVKMEKAGVPIVYCYDNENPLAYYIDPREGDWPQKTLNGMNVATPTRLDCKTPKCDEHGTLLQWVKTQMKRTADSPLNKFAEIIGRVRPNALRNGLLTVIYSSQANQKQAFGLTEEDLQKFYEWLWNHPGSTDPVIQKRILKIRKNAEQIRKKLNKIKRSRP